MDALKVDVLRTSVWRHRFGWPWVTENVVRRFHDPTAGVALSLGLDEHVRTFVETGRTWIGIAHNPPVTVTDIPPGASWLHNTDWAVSHRRMPALLKNCRALITLSQDFADILQRRYPGAPIFSLTHPMATLGHQFDLARHRKNKPRAIFFAGHWLRRIQSIYDLKVPAGWRKLLIRAPTRVPYLEKLTLSPNDTVRLLEPLSNERYDSLFGWALTFGDFYAASANNFVLESIMSNTPMLVRRLPATEEYLGKGYPMFFDELDQAGRLLTETDIEATHRYLAAMCKRRFHIDTFLAGLGEILEKVI